MCTSRVYSFCQSVREALADAYKRADLDIRERNQVLSHSTIQLDEVLHCMIHAARCKRIDLTHSQLEATEPMLELLSYRRGPFLRIAPLRLGLCRELFDRADEIVIPRDIALCLSAAGRVNLDPNICRAP